MHSGNLRADIRYIAAALYVLRQGFYPVKTSFPYPRLLENMDLAVRDLTYGTPAGILHYSCSRYSQACERANCSRFRSTSCFMACRSSEYSSSLGLLENVRSAASKGAKKEPSYQNNSGDLQEKNHWKIQTVLLLC